MLVPLRF